MPSKSRNNANLVSDNNLFVNPTTDNTGIGTLAPSAKLDVIGDVNVSGVLTATTFIGNLTGTATTATNLSNAANITTGTISSARLSGTYNINVSYANTSGISTVAQGLTGTPNITVGIVTASSFIGNLTGTATTSTNVIGGIGSITQLQVTGISTFTNGPVFIGAATSTGTASQRLQVTGGAYVSSSTGIGTTNPRSTLHVLGNVLVAAGASTDQYITLNPYELSNGTLSWEGSAGQLFSITNSLSTGSIFSVNDISGIPSIDVDAGGAVTLGAYGGNIGIGLINPTSKLHVVGTALITGTTTLGITTATNLTSQNLNVSGISTLGTVQVSSGIITATSGIVTYYGDGSKLSNLGVGIQSGGVTIGTGITTINFTGIANSITVSGSTATIRINGNVLSGFSTTNFTTPTGDFTSSTVPVSGTITANYILTGLSPYQLVNVVGIASGGTLSTPSVLTDGSGNATGTLTYAAGISSYPSGVNQTISFISNNTTLTKNWNITVIAAPGDTLVFGWDQVNDLYGWYQFGQTTKLYDIAGNEQFVDLSVHSRVRRCIVNDAGVVQYYLDADNSGFRSGDWLRIVERQSINVAYTGTHTETTNSYLRLTTPSWSAGTYTLGQRVTYSGSIWECVVASTTATPAAGSVSSDLTGGAGQVMTEVPAFCVGHAVNGNIHTFGVKLGTTPPAGYEVHPAFIKTDGSYRSYFYTGAYQSTGTSPATTISGASNRTNATRATFRTSATSRGTGWHQLSHYEYSALQFLLITEFQSVNSQKVLGNGAQEGAVYVVNTGLSNLQGNRSQNRYTVGGNGGDYVSYRGLENIYGRAWMWSDGINVNGTNVYLNKNWTTWADDTATNYTLVGDLGTGTVSGSYITNFLSLINVLLPSSVTGGNSTSKVADGLYTSTGWRVSGVGGSASDGALVGVFYFPFNSASSFANTAVGGRLSFAPV